MPAEYPNTLAIYAAGIADSFRYFQAQTKKGRSRYDALIDKYDGQIGLLYEIAEAAEHMEAYRLSHGADSRWGIDLPYIYDVCDAIAKGLWSRLGDDDVEDIVKDALKELVVRQSV